MKIIPYLALFFSFLLQPVGGYAEQLRASSAPYISGDTFREEADFIFDETTTDFRPEDVRRGNVVFVKTDMLSDFFNDKHDFIPEPYILITHNADHSVPDIYAAYLEDPKIIAWMGQNVQGYTHPKLIPIPIGLANRYWSHGSIETMGIASRWSHNQHRPTLVAITFTASPHAPMRIPIYEKFKNEPFVTVHPFKNYPLYLRDSSQAKFMLSPPGNGYDCHRTWEALYMGAIPIVITSAADSMFYDLPVVIVKSWDEVTEAFLLQQYREIKAKSLSREKAYFPYWKKLIDSYRRK
ncbi:MAG: hypothetical protein S4CHLAM102_07470 [Chlamydiia bacterium]|nr:hypothetical protein [Chlamydiia bacterium]